MTPNLGSNVLAFDHHALANVLKRYAGQDVDANSLPFAEIDLDLDLQTVQFSAHGKRWEFDKNKGACKEISVLLEPLEVISPDGKLVVFSKSHNLWLRNLELNEEKALTTDGTEDYGYGETGSAWGTSLDNELQVIWSADSSRIFFVRKDRRQVESLGIMQHVPQVTSARPRVSHQKIAYPGDENIEVLELLFLDIESGNVVSADYPAIPVTRNGWGFFVPILVGGIKMANLLIL